MRHVTLTPGKRPGSMIATFDNNTDKSVELTASQLTKIFDLAQYALASMAKERQNRFITYAARNNEPKPKRRSNETLCGPVYGPIWVKLRNMKAKVR